jgi:hypothetical protein
LGSFWPRSPVLARRSLVAAARIGRGSGGLNLTNGGWDPGALMREGVRDRFIAPPSPWHGYFSSQHSWGDPLVHPRGCREIMLMRQAWRGSSRPARCASEQRFSELTEELARELMRRWARRQTLDPYFTYSLRLSRSLPRGRADRRPSAVGSHEPPSRGHYPTKSSARPFLRL